VVRSQEPEFGSVRSVVREDRRVTPEPGRRSASESLPPAPGGTVVIKIGGRSLEAPGAPEGLAAEVASLSGEALLVHGGGRDVSAWCEKLSLTPRFVGGLRVTDPETLEVAVAVLAGLANKKLVALLREAGVDAIGLAALDAGIAEVGPHPDAKVLGAVGQILSVDPDFLRALIADGRTPVLSSVGAFRGALLNLNADDVAAAVAAALGADTLVLLSDAPGVVLDGRPVESLAASELDAVVARSDVRDGMIAKLNAARVALAGGVGRVRIASWMGSGTLDALLGDGGAGTTLFASGSRAVSA
jgi:acetylglutamate kinase